MGRKHGDASPEGPKDPSRRHFRTPCLSNSNTHIHTHTSSHVRQQPFWGGTKAKRDTEWDKFWKGYVTRFVVEIGCSRLSNACEPNRKLDTSPKSWGKKIKYDYPPKKPKNPTLSWTMYQKKLNENTKKCIRGHKFGGVFVAHNQSWLHSKVLPVLEAQSLRPEGPMAARRSLPRRESRRQRAQFESFERTNKIYRCDP